MQKRITTTLTVILLTLTLMQLAAAQWEHNEFTNNTSGDLYVSFTTLQPAEDPIPQGWRTVGWYLIRPGASHTFRAWADNPIYYLIWEQDTKDYLTPANAKKFTFWEHINAFVTVSETEPNVPVAAEDLLYSNRNKGTLVENSEFFKSGNGGSVTVNATGVVAPLAETLLGGMTGGGGTISKPNTGNMTGESGINLAVTKHDGTPLPTQLESGDEINLIVKLTNNGLPIVGQKVTLQTTAVSIAKKPTLAVTKQIGEDGTVVTGGEFTSEFGVNTDEKGEIPVTMRLNLAATGTFKLTAAWGGIQGVISSVKNELTFQAALGPGAKAKSMEIVAYTNAYISRIPHSDKYIVEPKGGKFNNGTIQLVFSLTSEADKLLPNGNFLATVSTTKGSVAAEFDVAISSNPDKTNVNLKTGPDNKHPEGFVKVNLKLTNASTGDLIVTGHTAQDGLVVPAARLYITVRPTLHNLSVSGIGNLNSGQSRSVTATVTSKNGNKMPGVSISTTVSSSNLKFSTSSATPSSGVFNTNLQAKGKGSGSWRNVDSSSAYYSASPYSVTVSAKKDGVTKSKNSSVSVKPWKVRTNRSVWIDSQQAGCAVWVPEVCVLRFCTPGFCSYFNAKSQKSWGTNKYVNFPGTVVNIVDVDGNMSAGDKLLGATASINRRKISGSRVYVYGTIETHYVDPNNYRVTVTAQYEWTANSFDKKPPSNASGGAPSLRPELQPDMHQLSEIWQGLSQVPAKTALLPNYPNPFNPETWIPYHLSDPAEVTLSIYSTDGRLVRTLALGHQDAGIYESKSRAAYWDGRNSVGERVASGLYFYTLTAGDFAATGKMLIMK